MTDTRSFTVHNSSSPSPSSSTNSIASPSTPSSSSSTSPYAFLVEWFDSAASLARKFTLTYHPSDLTLELFDLRHHRLFLKRCSYPTVTLSSLYIGAHVTIYARTLKVIGYGDESTRSRLESDQGRALAVIKPAGATRIGAFLSAVHEGGLRVSRLKTLHCSLSQAQTFYGDSQPTPRAHELSSGRAIAVEVVGKGAHQQVQALLNSLGGGVAVPTSTNERTAGEELSFLFSLPSPATFSRCSLLLVKPHAVTAGQAGAIVTALQSQFAVTALQTFHLTRETAEEFLEAYKGVVGECTAWVEELSSGQCMAVEVTGKAGEEEKEMGGGGVVEALRALAGPYDPDIAKHLRKGSLRAKFGLNKVKNAVHVTDLPDDGPLESEFFFNLLQNTQ